MDSRRAAGALLALAVCFASSNAAPTASNQTGLDLYDGAAEGCYYNFQHYGEGDRIMTNEPCLNCTCHNRMLMCYLRVCPFTKPIGQDCTVEKRADQCCPIVTCPDVPVDLLTSTSTTSPAEYGATGVGKLDKYGCSIDGKYFAEGSKVPPTPNKPCEHCYCIRNMTTCVMQECTLHVDGCTPIYHKDVCCPVRYSCDHAEDEVLLLDDMTTTVRPTPGFLLTTTTVPPVTQMSQDCVHDDQIVPDGALIKTEKACEHCYCMKGDIVCVVQECGTPMENEGKNCTSQPPRDGQCCPDTYICEGDEIVTDNTELPTYITDKMEDLTTLSPPRRAEGSDYRKETDAPDTETEGSGYEQTSVPSFDVSETIATDELGSGYEHSTIPSFTDEHDHDNKYTILPNDVSNEDTTEPQVVVYEHTTPEVTDEAEKITKISDDRMSTITEKQYIEDELTVTPKIDMQTTEQEEIKYDGTTEPKPSEESTSFKDDSITEYTTRSSISSTVYDSEKEQTSENEPPTSSEADDEHTTNKQDTEFDHTILSSTEMSHKITDSHDIDSEITTVPSSEIFVKDTSDKQYSPDQITTLPSTSLYSTDTSETQDTERTTLPSSDADEISEKVDSDNVITTTSIDYKDTKEQERTTTPRDSENEKTTPSTIKISDKESEENKDDEYGVTTLPSGEDQGPSEYDRTTLAIPDTTDSVLSEKGDESTIMPSLEKDSSDKKESGAEGTTVPTIDELEKEISEIPVTADKATTISIIEESEKGTPEKSEAEDKGTTISTIDEPEKETSEKPDAEDKSTSLPSIDDFKTEKTEKYDTVDKTTTLPSIDDTTNQQGSSEGSTSLPNIDDLKTESPEKQVTSEKTTALPSFDDSKTDEPGKLEPEDENNVLPEKDTSEHYSDETTTFSNIDDSYENTPEKEESGHERTTLASIDDSEGDTSHKTTTLPSFDDSKKDISEKPDENYETTSLPDKISSQKPGIDDIYKGTSEKEDTGDERTTLASIDDYEKDTSEKEDSGDESTTLASIDESKKDTPEKEDSGDERTTLASIDDSEKDTSEKEGSGDERTTLASIDDSEKDTSEKEDNGDESTTLASIHDSKKDTPEKEDSGDERTTLASIDDSEKDTSEKEDNEEHLTTLPSFDTSEKETSEKQDHEMESTELPSNEPEKESSEKYGNEDERTTLPSIDDIKKQTPEYTYDERTTIPSAVPGEVDSNEQDSKDTSTTMPSAEESTKYNSNQDIRDEITTLSTIDKTRRPTSEGSTTMASELDSSNEFTTLASIYITKQDSEHSALPTLDEVTTDKYSEHEISSTVSAYDVDTSEKQSTDYTKESTDQSLVSSTSKTTTLEEIGMTTEPDKGLNTVPIGMSEEDLLKPFTTEKSSIIDDKTVTPSFVDDEKTIETIYTTEKENIDYITDTVDKIQPESPSTLITPAEEIIHYTTESKMPTDNELETKTETIHKTDVEVTTTDKAVAPETTTVDKIENEIYDYPRIPGEGDCLLNGVTYKNNSEVAKSNNCYTSCKCISSIIKCDQIICSPPPKYMDNCQPVYDSSDSCCPTYICQTGETLPPQPDSHVSVTDRPTTFECSGDKCEATDHKQSPTSSDKPLISDCGSTSCGDDSQVPVFIPPTSEIPADCNDGKCSSSDEICSTGNCKTDKPTQPCEGETCKGEPEIKPIVVKPVDGTSAVTLPASNEICKDNDCKKQEDDNISLPCIGESCRRQDAGELESKLPTVCTGSQCPPSKPHTEVKEDESTEAITVTTMQEIVSETEKQTDRTTIKQEVQTESPGDLEYSTELSNELPISEHKTTSETIYSVDTTEAPIAVSEHTPETQTDIPVEKVTSTEETSTTQGLDQEESIKETDGEDKATKPPEVVKETVTEAQSLTESPDLLTDTTRLPTLVTEIESEAPSVTESQATTTKSDRDESSQTDAVHLTDELPTGIPVVTDIQHVTTVSTPEITTKLYKEETELPDLYSTFVPSVNEIVEHATSTPKSELETDFITSTAKYIDEVTNKESETPISTTISSDESIHKKEEVSTESTLFIDNVTNKIEKEPHSEITTKPIVSDISELTTVAPKYEPSTVEDETMVTDEAVYSTPKHEEPDKESFTSTSILESEITSFTDKISPTTDKYEESKPTESSTTIKSETGVDFTELPATEQTDQISQEKTTEKVDHDFDNTVTSILEDEKTQTEGYLSQTTLPSMSDKSSSISLSQSELTTPKTDSDEIFTTPLESTDVNEVATTERVADNVTDKQIISEPYTDLPDSEQITTTQPVTEKEEIPTQEAIIPEATTISHKLLDDHKVSEFTEAPQLSTTTETEPKTEKTSETSDSQTTESTDVDSQSMVTKTPVKIDDKQPQTESPTEYPDDIKRTTVFEYTKEEKQTDSPISATISDITDKLQDEITTLYTEEEKLTTVVSTYDKEMAATQAPHVDQEHSTHPLEISTESQEMVPVVTESDVSITTSIPESHIKVQEEVTQTPYPEILDSTAQSERTETPHDISSELPHETTSNVLHEKDIETSTVYEMSSKAPVGDTETSKEPQELTTEQSLYKTSTDSHETVTDHVTKLPDLAITDLDIDSEKDSESTSTVKSLTTKIEYSDATTVKPDDAITDAIAEVTTIGLDKTSSHDLTEKEDLESITTLKPIDVAFEKTTVRSELTTNIVEDNVTEHVFESTTSKLLEIATSSSESDVSTKISPEPTEHITESYGSTETTPYVVELEEHTHKAIDEMSTTLIAEEESSTHLLEPHVEATTEKVIKDKEPVHDTHKPTLTDESAEKSTPLSLSEEVESEPTTSLPISSDDKHDTADLQTTTTPQDNVQSTHEIEQSPSTDGKIPVQTEKSPTTDKEYESVISHDTKVPDEDITYTTKKTTTAKIEEEITTTPSTFKPEDKPAEIIPETPKPGLNEILPTDEIPDDEGPFPPSDVPSGYGQESSDYGEEPFGPGTCRYGGKVYVSAQQIPRDDPCDFCFCFRSDIICLQQSCPPPIHGCHEEPIQGFCCPRYECPVAMATTLNVTTTTTTTTTTLPPHFFPHAYKGAAQRRGCQIKGHTYKVGEVVRASSGPCLHCTCGGDGQMKCDPKACTPEPMLRQMIAAAVSAKRRR